MVDNYIFSCSWDEFENWIKQQIDGDFSWKLRPIDSKGNRECPECKGIVPCPLEKVKNADSHKKTAGNNEQEN